MRDILMTAAAPVIWGTTYLVTTETLPADRPLLVGVLRILPLGLLVVGSRRQLPVGAWWWRSMVLGALNFGLFLPLLFIATYRLPGGVIATIGAIQPFIVAILAWALLKNELNSSSLLAAGIGLVGVSLLVLGPTEALDWLGLAAALGATLLMALGIVLVKRWGQPAAILDFTAWQFVAGGLMMVPLALAIEGLPPTFTAANLGGLLYIAIMGTGLAYALWFQGIKRINISMIPFLTLLVPLVAFMVDIVVLHRSFNLIQIEGSLLVLASIISTQRFAWFGERNLGRKDTLLGNEVPSSLTR